MTDIPSQSFGSETKWHCKSNSELLTLFNISFPLPNQLSWTFFQISYAVDMRVTSVLQIKDFTLVGGDYQRPGIMLGQLGSLCRTYGSGHLLTGVTVRVRLLSGLTRQAGSLSQITGCAAGARYLRSNSTLCLLMEAHTNHH